MSAFSLSAAQFVARRHPVGEVYQPRVKVGHPRFDRVRHRQPVEGAPEVDRRALVGDAGLQGAVTVLERRAEGVGEGAGQGGFLYDVSQPGNGNSGHEYGTALAADDKRALVEFLKTQ